MQNAYTFFKCTYFQDLRHGAHTILSQGSGTEENVFEKRKGFQGRFKRTDKGGMMVEYSISTAVSPSDCGVYLALTYETLVALFCI